MMGGMTAVTGQYLYVHRQLYQYRRDTWTGRVVDVQCSAVTGVWQWEGDQSEGGARGREEGS